MDRHRKLTLYKKIIPRSCQGLDPETFRSGVRRSTTKLSPLPKFKCKVYVCALVYDSDGFCFHLLHYYQPFDDCVNPMLLLSEHSQVIVLIRCYFSLNHSQVMVLIRCYCSLGLFTGDCVKPMLLLSEPFTGDCVNPMLLLSEHSQVIVLIRCYYSLSIHR